jgi:ATP-dependent DNA helicase RecQ
MSPETAEASVVERSDLDRVRQLARERFGIARLRHEQEEAIASILAGRDTLLILPTGGGKSLTYQLPSLLLPNPTIVVSPLLALLEDQFGKLEELGIPAIRLDSTVGVVARREALARLGKGGSLLVLTTPETLATEEVGKLLQKHPPSLVAVDEAHCISEWGHDFRPAYLSLGQRLQQLEVGQVLALTATATAPVRDDIVRYLSLRDPEIIVASPHRQNLIFEVRQLIGDQKLRDLAKLARRLPRPGIVYCSTTKAVDDVWLGLRLIKVPCARYHGKMTDKERALHQARFMRKGKRIVMVATSAFGLGIDKPDIRYIVHYQAPPSLERYVQEAGRAGRDGHLGRCLLLFDEADLQIQEHLLALSRLSPSLLGRFGRALTAWAGDERDANIEELALSAGISQRAATSLITVLVDAGIVERVGDGKRVRPLGELDDLVERVEGLRSRFEVLRREDSRRLREVVNYANETECRSISLRRYFGDEEPEPCGRCDLCRQNGVSAPERTNRRRRRRGRPRPGEGRPMREAPAAAPEKGRSRRKRRRRRGERDRPAAAAPAAPAVVAASILPPLEHVSREIAADLGAPALPPPLEMAEPTVSVRPEPAGHPRPRRRRRRRSGGPRSDRAPQPSRAEI